MKKLILAFAVLLLATHVSATTTYSITKGFGRQWDTLMLKVKHHCNVTRDSVIYTNKALVDTNLSFGEDTLFTVLVLYKNNGGYWQSYGETFIKTTLNGFFEWNTPSYIGVSATDSLVVRYSANGLPTYQENLGNVTSFLGIGAECANIYRDTLYRIDLDWYSIGASYPITQTWLMYWDSTGGSSLPSSGQSHVCAVTAQILNSDRTSAVGVWVTAYLMASNVHDSSGVGYTNTPMYKQTDANGRVTFNCVWSSYLIPSTKWRFTAHTSAIGGMRQTIEVPRLSSYFLNLSQ